MCEFLHSKLTENQNKKEQCLMRYYAPNYSGSKDVQKCN